jgi:hypothetical protein
VRALKASLLATVGRNGKTLSRGTVKKNLGALASVLAWAKREGLRNDQRRRGHHCHRQTDGTEGRLPYSPETREAEEYVLSVAEELRADGVAEVTTSVWEGSPARAVTEAALRENIDVIVEYPRPKGTQSRGAWERC